MAVKTFGHTDAVNYSRWGGSATYACVGLRSVMPEDGKVIKIALKLCRYSSGDIPIVWGAIWNRNTGNLLAVSAASVSPTNTFVNNSSFITYEFNLPETLIAAGTPLLIGLARNTQDANRRLTFAINNGKTGQTTDYYNLSRTSPGNFSSVSGSWGSEALWVEVTYKTGGQVKVWDGAIWQEKPVMVRASSVWEEKPVKHWDGSQWKESN